MPSPLRGVLHSAPFTRIMLINVTFVSDFCGSVHKRAGGCSFLWVGGSRNRAALLPTWMSPFLRTKDRIHLWLGTGWYRPSFSSRRDEPLYCYHELLLLVCCCSLTDETPGRGPATCCHKSCHEVLQLEMPLDKHPCILHEVPVLPTGPIGGFLFPIQNGHGLSLGSVGAGVDPRAVSNRHTFPFGHQRSDLASPERGVSPLQASFVAGSGRAFHSTQEP